MSLKPPHPNIEHLPIGEIPVDQLREHARKLQQNQEFFARRFPLQKRDLANNSVGAAQVEENAVGSSEIAENAVGASEIAAEAVGTSELATAAKQLFPQLVTAATRKINFGVTSITFTSSQTPAAKEVEHGLGTTPTVVIPVIKFNGNSSIFVNAGSYTSTKFTLGGFNANGVTTITIEVAWLAIG